MAMAASPSPIVTTAASYVEAPAPSVVRRSQVAGDPPAPEPAKALERRHHPDGPAARGGGAHGSLNRSIPPSVVVT